MTSEHESLSAAAPKQGAALDAASQAWLSGIQSSGVPHNHCISQLHALLLRVARYEVSRRAGLLRVRGPELEDIAVQASDDALMAIKTKIHDFRGESRFTTWAYRFVMFEVSMQMGRHFWRNRPVDMSQEHWERLPDLFSVTPHERIERREELQALRRAIDEDLTERQRTVFVAVALNEVSMDALARELGSNRNAVYKSLFDARRKLRSSLAAAGYSRPSDSAAL